jgi:pimeloyl-ACP methyl ester carboxylesterase
VAGFSRGEREAALPRIMWKSADEVARAAIDGLAANKSRVIPGRVNQLAATCYRVVPHRLLLAFFARRSLHPDPCATQGSFRGGKDHAMLEVIDKGAVSEAHPVPLLFVHGAWHAAWCWDEYFLSYFADKGYRALAVSFRGHGNSPISKPLRSCTVNDYVADVKSVADSLSTRPVVIGHSMGGLIVQKYLESNDAPAGVLMASIPPEGNYGSSLRWIQRHPWHAIKMAITGDSLPYINTAELAREKFFSAQTPEPDVLRCAARLQRESKRVSIDCLLLKLPRPRRVMAPLLVLGAEEDGAHTQKEVRATGRAYHTQAEFFPAMGHNMMLEPGWEAVAERIHSWLGARGL